MSPWTPALLNTRSGTPRRVGRRIEQGGHAGGIGDVGGHDRHGGIAGERGALPPGLLEPLRGDGQVREDQPGA